MDLFKAFDCILNDLVIAKLEVYGPDDYLIKTVCANKEAAYKKYIRCISIARHNYLPYF